MQVHVPYAYTYVIRSSNKMLLFMSIVIAYSYIIRLDETLKIIIIQFNIYKAFTRIFHTEVMSFADYLLIQIHY